MQARRANDFFCCALKGRIASRAKISANISSEPSAMSALEVRRYFGDRIDYLVPGDLGSLGGPSEIRMLATGEVLR